MENPIDLFLTEYVHSDRFLPNWVIDFVSSLIRFSSVELCEFCILLISAWVSAIDGLSRKMLCVYFSFGKLMFKVLL